ncbi:MAG: hypothetical protein ABS56_07355 [Lautropia sp. SCN 69-89]|nr:MAG: hypothetical protein ABS56_07355 [Lautropia sp. SCN 69-89]
MRPPIASPARSSSTRREPGPMRMRRGGTAASMRCTTMHADTKTRSSESGTPKVCTAEQGSIHRPCPADGAKLHARATRMRAG